MKTLMLVLAAVLVGWVDSSPLQSAEPALALTHANVITMASADVQRDVTIIVRNRHIAAMGPTTVVAIPAGAIEINVSGQFLTPGLIDMHVHLEDDDVARQYLGYGVTTVRNMSADGDHFGRKERLAAGTVLGPAMFTSGPALQMNSPDYAFNVTSPSQARERVRDSHAKGADWIKTIRMDLDVFEAILDEAAKVGLPVGGHLPDLKAPLLDVYRSTFRSHEHVAEVFTAESGFNLTPDPARLPVLAREIQQTGISISTILHRETTWQQMRREGDSYLAPARLEEIQRLVGEKGVADARQFLAGLKDEAPATRTRTETIYKNLPFILQIVRALNDAGVPLVVGTDSHFYFSLAGRSLHDELDLLRTAGLSEYDALKTATTNAATLLNAAGRLGVIAVGAEADLVLSDTNPLTDLSALRTPAAVIVDGRWLERDALAAMRGGSTPLPVGRGNAHRPVWFPDGRSILFMSNRTGDWELYRTAPGRQPERLTTHEGWDGYADVSPDGRWVVFDRNDEREGARVIRLDLATGSEVELIRFPTKGGGPRWAPDGRRIAFWREDAGNRDIYLMEADGRGAAPLTRTPESEHDPVFSPDGTRIAMAVQLGDGNAIDVMDTDGGHRRRLLTESGGLYGLAWSPDGTRIAFNAEVGGVQRLFLVDVDGTNRRRLSGPDQIDHLADWSPDGTTLIFTTQRDDREWIQQMDIASGWRADVPVDDSPTVREYLAHQLAGSRIWRQDNPRFQPGGDEPRFWERRLALGPGPHVVMADAVAVMESGECRPLSHMVYSEKAGALATDAFAGGDVRLSGRLVQMNDTWAIEAEGRDPLGNVLRMRDVPLAAGPGFYTTVGYRWNDHAWVRLDETTWREAPQTGCRSR